MEHLQLGARTRTVMAVAVAVVLTGCGGADLSAAPPEPAAPVVSVSLAEPGAADEDDEPPEPELSLPPAGQARPYLQLVQDRRRQRITDGASVKLSRRPYAFVLPVTGGGAYFAGSEKERVHRIEVGDGVEDHAGEVVLFAKGMTFASDEDGYHAFVLSDEGHHYIYHDPRSRLRRAELQRRLGPERYEVRFNVSAYYYQGQVLEVAALPLAELFFVAFIDDDADGVIDEGELFRFTLRFG